MNLNDNGDFGILPPGFQPASATPAAPAVPVVEAPAAQSTPDPVAPQVPEPAPAPVAEAPAVTNVVDDPPANPDIIIEDILMKGLDAATLGKVKTLADLHAILAEREQLPVLQQQMAELQQKIAVDPFANPTAKKVNELLAKGASPAEVAHFLHLQNVDTTQLKPLDAVRMATKVENPTFDDAEIDAHLADLGLETYVDGGDPTARDSIRLKKAHEAAVRTIENMKVASANPTTIAQGAPQANQEALRTAYTGVAASIIGQNKTVTIGEGADALQYPIDANTLAHAQKYLIDAAVAGEWDATTAEGAQLAQQRLSQFIYSVHGPEIMKAAMQHSAAIAKREAVKATAGAAPVPAPKPITTQPPPVATRPPAQNLIL